MTNSQYELVGDPWWVRFMKAAVYLGLGMTIPVAWAVAIKIVSEGETEIGPEQAQAFEMMANFVGIVSMICFILVFVEMAGPHRLHRIFKSKGVKSWRYLRTVMSS